MPNAGELLNSLQETLGFRKKKPTEALAAAGTLPVVPTETPALELAPAIMPEPTATETPSLAPEAAVAVPAGGLPDWLNAPSAVEPIPTPTAIPDWLQGGQMAVEETTPAAEAPVEAPTPVPEAPTALPAVEAPALETPVAPPTAEAEKSPEQLAIEQFEEALLKAKKTMTGLLENQNFKQEELTAAMAAAAVANGLIPKLPEHYLEVLLASRILGEQRNYTRMDFQESMSAAIKYFMKAQKG